MKIKKIFIIFAIFILLTGCTKTDTEEKEKTKYQKYVKSLEQVSESTEKLPFDVNVEYDKMSKNEIRYQVIIDNPKEDLNDIEAIAIHNMQTDDIFPNIGIFDKKESLKKNKKPSGIILVGYIPYSGKIKELDCTIKVLIKYTDKEKSDVVYYVTKNDE